MTDRELLQQALNALETADEFDFWLKQESIVKALRDRLAHCDRCGKKLGGEGDIHTCSPKPEQEPVALKETTQKAVVLLKTVIAGLESAIAKTPMPTNCRRCGGPDNVICAGQCEQAAPLAVQPAMFGPMGTVGDLFDKHVIANGNLKKEWIVYLEKNT